MLDKFIQKAIYFCNVTDYLHEIIFIECTLTLTFYWICKSQVSFTKYHTISRCVCISEFLSTIFQHSFDRTHTRFDSTSMYKIFSNFHSTCQVQSFKSNCRVAILLTWKELVRENQNRKKTNHRHRKRKTNDNNHKWTS